MILTIYDMVVLRKRSSHDEMTGYIPPSTMIPQRRLSSLLRQAHNYQRAKCLYANSSSNSSQLSLFADRPCDKTIFPRLTTAILEVHNDEVWNIEFSHDGKFLASASKDKTVIIWRIGVCTQFFSRRSGR